MKVEQLVNSLADAKAELASIQAELSVLETEWKEQSGWNRVAAKAQVVQEKVNEADDRLRQFALNSYAQTGRPTIFSPHVYVRLRPKIQYPDDQVVTWAITENHKQYLRVNKVEFNKLALQLHNVAPLPFVTVERVPTVVLKGI